MEGSASPIDTPADKQSFSLIRSVYQACMNETEIQRLGTSPLLKVLDRISQLLPVNASAYSTLNSTMLRESDAADVGQALLYLQRVGLDPIVSVSVTIDDKNPVSTYIHSYHSLHGQLTNTVKKSRIVKIAPTSHMVMAEELENRLEKVERFVEAEKASQ